MLGRLRDVLDTPALQRLQRVYYRRKREAIVRDTGHRYLYYTSHTSRLLPLVSGRTEGVPNNALPLA